LVQLRFQRFAPLQQFLYPRHDPMFRVVHLLVVIDGRGT
jgi:hypothetical protein